MKAGVATSPCEVWKLPALAGPGAPEEVLVKEKLGLVIFGMGGFDFLNKN
jgi:hypothetical protein